MDWKSAKVEVGKRISKKIAVVPAKMVIAWTKENYSTFCNSHSLDYGIGNGYGTKWLDVRELQK